MTDERLGRFELGTDGPNVIVVGLDAGQIERTEAQSSLHAAAYAAGLARRQGARLVAVWVRPRVSYSDTMVDTLDEIAKGRKATEDEVRAFVARAAEYYGIPRTSLVVREGEPFDQLTAVAEDVRADAIVVGASEQRIGSLAVRLVRDGRWPVTVVP